MGIGDEKFERILDKYKRAISRTAQDTDLEVSDLQKLIADYKALYEKEIGSPFPQDPYKQLFIAIEAVFKSWNNKRAITYRKISNIPNFGDRLYTDIKMGIGAGVTTCCVLSGETTLEMIERSDANKPDYVIDGIWDIPELLKR
ncbi:unnamed protein product [marine sediment metagenome]|uniref:Uncharacterized protein n=1 Tax=marine sediment metagenome TaxID=412755 RepID=X1AKK0_9ZZZZ